MQSSKKYEVQARINGTPEWGVYPTGQNDFWLASLKCQEHAQRLCDMLNDINIDEVDGNYEMQNDNTNKRTAQTTKLFCMQENLTWADLGLEERHIRVINKFLEQGN